MNKLGYLIFFIVFVIVTMAVQAVLFASTISMESFYIAFGGGIIALAIIHITRKLNNKAV